MAGLPAPAKRVLGAASALGQQFSLDVLTAVLEQPERALLEVLDAAAEAGVIREEVGSSGRHVFARASPSPRRSRPSNSKAIPYPPTRSDHGWPDYAANHRLLGNGYCTRPPELDCPFEAICETCTCFHTSIEFRPTLQRQTRHATEHSQAHRADLFGRLLTRVDEQAS